MSKLTEQILPSLALPIMALALLALTLASCDDDSVAEPPPAIPGFDLGPLLDFGDIGTPGVPDVASPMDTLTLDTNDEPDVEVGSVDTQQQDVCIPKCSGKECGPNGCGDFCGQCESGSSCSAVGLCESNGDFCSGAFLVSNFPTTLELNMDDFANNFDCGESATSGDLIIDIRPGSGTPIYATVKGPGELQLAAADTCGLGVTCTSTGTTAITATPTENAFFISVEQLDPTAKGTVIFEVQTCASFCDQTTCGVSPCGTICECPSGKSCVEGACIESPPGDGCANNPIPINSLPISDAGVLTGFSDSESCANTDAGLPERVWVHSPPFSTSATISLTGDAGVHLWVNESSCNGSCDPLLEQGQAIGIQLEANTSYFFIVEGPADAAYSFDITPCDPTSCSATCPCPLGAQCESGICVTPTTGDNCNNTETLVDSLVWSTSALTDAISCPSNPIIGADAVFEFTAQAAGTHTFTATANRPLQLHQLSDCTAATPQCIASSEASNALTVELSEGETTFLVVEETQQNITGGFSVSAENCTAACTDAPCDTLACGTICGCEEGKTCIDGTCLQAAPLDDCSTAETISVAPAVVVGTFESLSDAVVCANNAGSGTPEAVYRFIAPSTGIFNLGVLGTANPKLFFPFACGGGSGCSAPVTSTLVQLDKDQEQWIAVDGAPESAYELSISRVLGVAGGLGAGCETVGDCPLAHACIAGVCTLECSPDGQDTACLGPADGPRGTDYTCNAAVCAPTSSGCVPVCLPYVGTTLTCDGPADCSAGFCTGFFTDNNSLEPTATCLAADQSQFTNVGACATGTECTTNICHNGQCAEPCLFTTACEDSALCTLYVDKPNSNVIAGTCQNSINALPNTTCNNDSECAFGFCDGHIGPNGVERYCALLVGEGTLGTPCSSALDCQYATCLFNNDIGFEPAYCSRICNHDSDCSADMTCRAVTLYDNQTDMLEDDFSIKRCVKGAINQSCSLTGLDICDAGLTCTNVGLNQGVCQPM